MNHLHLPVQSGNNRILRLMRRNHTVEEYLDWIAELQAEVPDLALSTDIIVGFPGETESEFEDTLRLMERAGYSSSFMFCYSPRPGTPAAAWPDTVPPEVKRARLQQTIELQNRLTERQGRAFLGTPVEVLVEGRSTRPGTQFKGRNPQYWRVEFNAEPGTVRPGDRVWVRVDEVSGHTLKGSALPQ